MPNILYTFVVDTPNIKDGAITNEKIASGTITGDKIVDRTITKTKVALNTLTGSEIAVESIERDKFEIGSGDISFIYWLVTGKAAWYLRNNQYIQHTLYSTFPLTDYAVEVRPFSPYYPFAFARSDTVNNEYYIYFSGEANGYYILAIAKIVKGTVTNIANTSNIFPLANYKFKLSVIGTTLKAFGVDMINPRLTVTDTTFASGRFGVGSAIDFFTVNILGAYMRTATSPAPRPVAYFEVPIIGSGTDTDPYRAKMPEQIETVTLPNGKQNIIDRLILNHSALIVTDDKGQPLDTAIVRIFSEPERNVDLLPLTECIKTLRMQPRVRELTVSEAITLAKQMDPKLTDYDLHTMPSPLHSEIEDYIEARKRIHDVDTDFETAKHYLQDEKGWI